jgi:hypothetical protein
MVQSAGTATTPKAATRWQGHWGRRWSWVTHVRAGGLESQADPDSSPLVYVSLRVSLSGAPAALDGTGISESTEKPEERTHCTAAAVRTAVHIGHNWGSGERTRPHHRTPHVRQRGFTTIGTHLCLLFRHTPFLSSCANGFCVTPERSPRKRKTRGAPTACWHRTASALTTSRTCEPFADKAVELRAARAPLGRNRIVINIGASPQAFGANSITRTAHARIPVMLN